MGSGGHNCEEGIHVELDWVSTTRMMGPTVATKLSGECLAALSRQVLK